MRRNIVLLLAGMVVSSFLFSCSSVYEPYRENSMGNHFYVEARDVFFYNGIEPLSRALRLNIVDTISDPGRKDAMMSYLLEKMSVYRSGNLLEIGSMNYDTGGKGICEDGAVWTVTNDYIDDFECVIRYAGNNSWNVSFDALMKVYGYYTDIRVRGEYLFRYDADEHEDTEQNFVIEYAEGSYQDERNVSEGIGMIDVRIDDPVNIRYLFYNEKYTPMPLEVGRYLEDEDIHLYKGRFSIGVTTMPDYELDSETYIFDLSRSDRSTHEVYVSYNGVWSPIF